MGKYLVFSDGEAVQLSPITCNEFMAIDLWYGASDMAFDAWLRKNKLSEARDFNEEALSSAKFMMVDYADEVSLEDLLFNTKSNELDSIHWQSYKSWDNRAVNSLPLELVKDRG